jgi:hypothetical protein
LDVCIEIAAHFGTAVTSTIRCGWISGGQ